MQRQLRLGDHIDDYCPRERRLTNHAIVAMVGDEVKQTRCMTCDAEHPYKRAQVPVARRKRESVSAAYHSVLASVQQEEAAPPVVARVADVAREAPPEAPAARPVEPENAAAASAVVRPPVTPSEEKPAPPVPAAPPPVAAASPSARAPRDHGPDEGRVHRRLIRAQLPRLEGKEPTPRPIPQFTIHDPRAAAFHGRGGQRVGGGGGRHGNRAPFTRDAAGRGRGFSPKPPKPGQHARHGGRSRKSGKKQPK